LMAVEKGIQAIPLLKRKLEGEDNVPKEKNYKIPVSIFLGFLALSFFYEIGRMPELFIPLIIIDVIVFVLLMIKK
ncbi:MAG: ABC1 kinase family protein, partial [Thermoplasmata archaeon]